MSGRRAGREAGFSTVEVVLLAPVFVTVMLLVVVLGRVQEAGVEVTGAARDGARAASLARTPEAAVVAGRVAVGETLAGQSWGCAGGPATTVDTGGLVPGGLVRVRVSCVVALRDVGMSGVPGTAVLSREATSPVDTFRGIS